MANTYVDTTIYVRDAVASVLYSRLVDQLYMDQRLAFLPDGRLVPGGYDPAIRFWNIHAGTGSEPHQIEPVDKIETIDSASKEIRAETLDMVAQRVDAGSLSIKVQLHSVLVVYAIISTLF